MFKFPKDNFVFLETNRFDRENFRSYLFFNPIKIISCCSLEGVKSAFFAIESFIAKGYYVAGYISYEAGFALEDALKLSRKESTLPLLWFGIYKGPVISKAEGNSLLNSKRESYKMSNPRSNTSHEEYVGNIKKIKGFIRCGDTYQVNYTFKYKFDFRGSAYSLYKDLREKQRVSYSAFINIGDFSILSLSPELFFQERER